MGVVTSVSSLLISAAAKHPDEFRACVAVAANRMHQVVMNPAADDRGYVYHHVPAPWVTVKLLRLLQLFPFPEDGAVAARLTESLRKLLSRATDISLPSGRRARSSQINGTHACVVEAINLIAHYDNDAELQIEACTILGTMLIARDVNQRFSALEGLTVMAQTEFSHDAVKKHQGAVLRALQTEKDPTVQRRAADLLYALCDQESVETIVDQLLDFLKRADYAIREELAIKVAILAEKYVPVYSWYVDVMLRLIKQTGDYVPEQVWHRVIQVVINRQDVQDYAAKTCFEAILDPSAHEAMISVAGYILGEFGHLIANDPNSSPAKQLDALQVHYPMAQAQTRALLVSTYAKMANLFPELKQAVLVLLQSENLLRNSDAELQQRANEYVQLLSSANTDLVPAVFEEMPPFNEEQCAMLQRLEDKSTAAATDVVMG
jgi:AP-2 complex subunit alpha